jgi:hypothetical protein
MRRLLTGFAVLLVGAWLIAGCGGDDDSSQATRAAPTAPVPFEAESALIGLEDLPAGWAEDTDDDDEDDDDFCGREASVKPLDKASWAWA